MKKVEITDTQTADYNRMLNCLNRIANDYQTPSRMRKLSCLDFEETIEMAYENIQEEAKEAIKGVKPL